MDRSIWRQGRTDASKPTSPDSSLRSISIALIRFSSISFITPRRRSASAQPYDVTCTARTGSAGRRGMISTATRRVALFPARSTASSRSLRGSGGEMRAAKRPSSTSAARPAISRRAPGSILPSSTSGRRGLAAAGPSSSIDGGVVSTEALQPRVVSAPRKPPPLLTSTRCSPSGSAPGRSVSVEPLRRAGGDVAPVELPPHVARAGHGELELRQAGGVHVRARDGPGRLQETARRRSVRPQPPP